jgi:hypothetical protein
MGHMTFQEYLDRNNKLLTKPAVKDIADYDGTVETKPAKEKKHKDAGGIGQTGDVKPYKVGMDAKDPNKNTMKDGLADKGDSAMKYNPKMTSGKGDNMPGGTKKASWPKTPTQEWVEKTKNLSLAEFTKVIRNEALQGYSECGCGETPVDTIKKTVEVCRCSNRNVSALVREMKRNGLFSDLVTEMAHHQETFDVIANLMEDEIYARKLAKSLNEMVAPPVGGDEPMMGKKKPDMNMNGSEEDMGDEEDMDMDDMDMGSEDDMDSEDMDDMDSEDMDDMDSEDMDDMDSEDMDDMDSEDMDDMDDMDSEEDIPPRPKAAHNLMSAMKDHPALMNYR